MAILLTNDDGIDAPGLAALAEALAGLDTLYVAAPAENKSGVGMGITIERDMEARVHSSGRHGEIRHSLDGTPADAVKYGLQHLLAGDRPRLVVSGINLGPNLGRNVRCSGTVGAAFEAVAAGIPALAVSVDYVVPTNWNGGKFYARKLAEMMLREAAPGREPHVLNLNVPSLDPEDIRGLVIARQGKGGILDCLESDADGRTFSLAAQRIDTGRADCDASAFRDGYAVVTPLRYEMTHDALLEELVSSWGEELRRYSFSEGQEDRK